MRTLFPLSLVLVALGGCTENLLQPPPVDPQTQSNRLTLNGRVCTDPPNPSGFPVKVVLVVDQSGSMCVSDPPGSQELSGFCQMAGALLPQQTQPARVRALLRLFDEFSRRPNVQVSLLPFETNVKGQFPTSGQRFAPMSQAFVDRVQNLQTQLGKGTDYQGALAAAYNLIVSDINAVQERDPASLPRTRYIVVFLTDGTPYPRCAANDNLSQYADDLNPELTWADSSGSGDFCNTIDPEDPDAITGFVSGTDRNQNYQLFSYVDQLMELKDQYNIGDIRMNTVLLFNEEAVRACGPICQDLYGTYPRVPPAEYPQAAKRIASWVLSEFARRGNGVYQEFNDFGGLGQLSLSNIDYASLASPNVMKTLLVQSLSSEPGEDSRQVDTDGDGLIDELDNDFSARTSRFASDSDFDGLDDFFEVRRRDQGYRPDQKDLRGCRRVANDAFLADRPPCRDTDGDGLYSTLESELIRTRPSLVDSDGDGMPDGLEVRYGLDPLKATLAGLDTDGDGIPDVDELKAGSSPIRRDKPFFDRNAYQYDVRSETQRDGRVCYDFDVSNLQLVTPPSQAGQRQGFNLFKLWFAQAPESGASTDYGEWKAACAWAQYDPPSVRVPAGPVLQPAFNTGNFVAPETLTEAADYERACVGVSPSRGQTGRLP